MSDQNTNTQDYTVLATGGLTLQNGTVVECGALVTLDPQADATAGFLADGLIQTVEVAPVVDENCAEYTVTPNQSVQTEDGITHDRSAVIQLNPNADETKELLAKGLITIGGAMTVADNSSQAQGSVV